MYLLFNKTGSYYFFILSLILTISVLVGLFFISFATNSFGDYFCGTDKQVIYKIDTDSRYCVTEKAFPKLIERGWVAFTNSTKPAIFLDKTVYSWTDMVHIAVFAPNYNLNSNEIDVIGNSIQNPVTISTKHHTLDQYKLVETGPNTDIFTGHIILTGFKHDADGSKRTGDKNGYDTNPRTGDGNGTTIGLGPTNGFLENTNDDEITASFKFSKDRTVFTSSTISWNIGTVQLFGEVADKVELDEHSVYSIIGGIIPIRVIDPDMNLNPERPDDFDLGVWSDTDSSGVDSTVTETGNTTGIFEGTIYTTSYPQGGHMLVVDVGDTINVEYEDHTLPNQHTNNTDVLYVVESALHSKPPLKRISIIDLRVSDTLNNGVVDDTTGHKPIQITAEIRNNQKQSQEFVYIIQIHNSNNETVFLDWIKHEPSKRPSGGIYDLINAKKTQEKHGIPSVTVSWLPDDPSDTYTVTAFVWKSLVNAAPLSPTSEIIIPH